MKKYAVFWAFLVFMNAAAASAWVEPQAGENIPAPLNTSGQEQTKKGILNLNNWLKVLGDAFSFDIGIEAPKYCIKKPDGSTSCCPPQAGQDWSACGTGGGIVPGEAKWVWNRVDVQSLLKTPNPEINAYSVGAFDLVTVDPSGFLTPVNTVCRCSFNGYKWVTSGSGNSPPMVLHDFPKNFYENYPRKPYCEYKSGLFNSHFYYCPISYGEYVRPESRRKYIELISEGKMLIPSCAESCAGSNKDNSY